MVQLLKSLYLTPPVEVRPEDLEEDLSTPQLRTYYNKLIELHAVASKYLAPKTCTLAQEVVQFTLDDMDRRDFDMGVFLGMVRQVYVRRADEAICFRKGLVDFFTEHVSSVEGNEEFKEAVATVPAFAVDVMEGLMKQREESKGSGGTRATKKRKVGA